MVSTAEGAAARGRGREVRCKAVADAGCLCSVALADHVEGANCFVGVPPMMQATLDQLRRLWLRIEGSARGSPRVSAGVGRSTAAERGAADGAGAGTVMATRVDSTSSGGATDQLLKPRQAQLPLAACGDTRRSVCACSPPANVRCGPAQHSHGAW